MTNYKINQIAFKLRSDIEEGRDFNEAVNGKLTNADDRKEALAHESEIMNRIWEIA